MTTKSDLKIKKLEEENVRLKKEVLETRGMYKQLIQENTTESYDERRIMMLKCQIMQLERQLLLMSDALGSRADTLLEVEQTLHSIADMCRRYITLEVSGPEVPLPRSELTKTVQAAESARIKLYKSIENNSVQNLSRPSLMMSDFTRHTDEDPVTLMEICSGTLEHLYLKHVGKLESRLCSVYKKLSGIRRSLATTLSHDLPTANQHIPKPSVRHLDYQLEGGCKLLEETCQDLLALSVLVPNAPLPALRTSVVRDLTTDAVMSILPKFPRNKAAEGRELIDGLVKACNYSVAMAKAEIRVLERELKFHESVYDSQVEYAMSLLEAMKEGYANFEQSANELICNPLKGVLKDYERLKTPPSQESLREFLTVFTQHAAQFQYAVDVLENREGNNESGGKVLSIFAENFYKKIDKEKLKCQKERDKLNEELQTAKELKQDAVDKCTDMFKLDLDANDEHVATNISADVNELTEDIYKTVYQRSFRSTGDLSDRSAKDQPLVSPSGSKGRNSLADRPPFSIPAISAEDIEASDLQLRRTPIEKKGKKTLKRASSLDNRPPFVVPVPEEEHIEQSKSKTRTKKKQMSLDDRPPFSLETDVVNDCTCGSSTPTHDHVAQPWIKPDSTITTQDHAAQSRTKPQGFNINPEAILNPSETALDYTDQYSTNKPPFFHQKKAGSTNRRSGSLSRLSPIGHNTPTTFTDKISGIVSSSPNSSPIPDETPLRKSGSLNKLSMGRRSTSSSKPPAGVPMQKLRLTPKSIKK
ncbi:unnamed protein product [Owenia fusiformis]|uniref:Uncharacterized protein n=1 Tax=Owenia fusiformis TaxID=6347 RepID=A0A8S4PTP2_OWEFU|nr:unnamed protein product [Owenia fusiformis]